MTLYKYNIHKCTTNVENYTTITFLRKPWIDIAKINKKMYVAETKQVKNTNFYNLFGSLFVVTML